MQAGSDLSGGLGSSGTALDFDKETKNKHVNCDKKLRPIVVPEATHDHE